MRAVLSLFWIIIGLPFGLVGFFSRLIWLTLKFGWICGEEFKDWLAKA